MAAAKRELNPFDNTEEDAPKVPIEEPESDDPKIPLEAVDDESDESDGEEGAQQQTRSEKKRNRWREHADRANKLSEELAAERAAREAESKANQAAVQAALEQSRQALAALAAQQQAGQKQNQPDPLDEQEAQARREEQNVYREYEIRTRDQKNPLTREEQAAYEKRLQDARDKITDVRVERKVRSLPQAQQQNVNPAVEAIRAQITLRHPELSSNQQAQLHADGIWRTMIAAGKPNDWTTIEAALEETDKAFKFGKHKNADVPRPDPSLKDKLQGQPRGGAANGAEAPKAIVMTPGLRKLADRAFAHLPADQRYQKWAREVGAQLIKEGVDLSQYR